MGGCAQGEHIFRCLPKFFRLLWQRENRKESLITGT